MFHSCCFSFNSLHLAKIQLNNAVLPTNSTTDAIVESVTVYAIEKAIPTKNPKTIAPKPQYFIFIKASRKNPKI